jgi:hypothetical protein
MSTITIGPIISLSLPKSGTTTFAHALRHAGLAVADWRIHRHETDNADLHDQLLAPLIYEDYFDSGDPLARLGQFQAITEMNAVNKHLSLWPQTDSGILAAIERHHPDVRFVLSLRDPAKVANSMMNWNNLGKRRLPQADVPGLPRPYGGSVSDLARWIEGHYAFCDRMFRGSSQFLAYELEDPDVQTKISHFLKLDLPWWGKANENPDKADPTRQEG